MFFAFQRGTLELGILFHYLLAVLLDKPHNLSEAQAAHPGTVAKIRRGHVGEAPTWHSTWLSPLCPGTVTTSPSLFLSLSRGC